MHIKQIVIQGFKSYKDQMVMEPFSPNLNIIVGRNGSGKSNFFFAIRFVLNDVYANMSREERQSLLHEGTGPATLSAYVEIIIDNSDLRFPTGKEEVTLRRTIGLKKDEYSLDRKSVPKSEIQSLLESAGFSKHNPYYIVPQGRITALTSMKSGDRLELLKEIAGCSSYEVKRLESLRMLEESDLKGMKMEECVVYIEERLRELEKEKEELEMFWEVERERRAVEFRIYQREQVDVCEQLEGLEEERKMVGEVGLSERVEVEKFVEERVGKEERLAGVRRELEELGELVDLVRREREVVMKEKMRMDILVSDEMIRMEQTNDEHVTMKKELSKLEQYIQKKEGLLKRVESELLELQKNEEPIRLEYEQLSRQLEMLEKRHGRVLQFRNRYDRDVWLKREIGSTVLHKKQLLKEVEHLNQEIVKEEKQCLLLKKEVLEMESEMQTFEETKKEMELKMRQLKEEREGMYDRKKELWRQECQLSSKVSFLKDELKKQQRLMNGLLDKNVCMGLESVFRLSSELGLGSRVYGPVYELFEVDSVYRTVVEVVGGMSLFHVVVDDDQTAGLMLEKMAEGRLGRVTFIPMNRLRTKPDHEKEGAEGEGEAEGVRELKEECLELVRQLKYDHKFEHVFQHLFGRVRICPTLEKCTEVMQKLAVTGITLDGDLVERKGTMKGGYTDIKQSRMRQISQVKKVQRELSRVEFDLERVREEGKRVEAEGLRVTGEMSQLETKMKRGLFLSDSEVDVKRLLLKQTEEQVLVMTQRLELLEQRVKQLDMTVEQMTQELKEEMREMTEQEKREYEKGMERKLEIEQGMKEMVQERSGLEQKRNQIQMELDHHLNRKRGDLLSRLQSSSTTDELDSMKAELKKQTLLLEQLNHRAEEMEQQMNQLMKEKHALEEELEQDSLKQQERDRQLHQRLNKMEKYLARRSILIQKRNDLFQKIRHLGALPDSLLHSHQHTPTNQLIKLLHRLNEELKRFGAVNQKANEQFQMFTKQRDLLMDRKRELEKGRVAIGEMIRVLDMRKEEAIERTFGQVRESFGEIWGRICPGGRGELIMEKSFTTGNTTQNSTMDNTQTSSMSNSYTGIDIKVSFTESQNLQGGLQMQQLSGGQKSLVALALIFSIQKCDPAPFFLFDEIDSNLDQAYRGFVVLS